MIVVVLCILLAIPLCVIVRAGDRRDDAEQEQFCKDWKKKHKK